MRRALQNPGYRKAALLALLVVLALLSAWLKRQAAPAPPTLATGSGGPDYYLKNFTITATGADGAPRHLIKANYMEYLSGQKELQFIAPQLLFHNRQDSSWRVTAERATISEQGDRILMQGKVLILRRAAAGGEELRVETADLLVLPESREARSAARVVVSTEDSTLAASGLRIDLARDHMELLQQVRGRYYAPAT